MIVGCVGGSNPRFGIQSGLCVVRGGRCLKFYGIGACHMFACMDYHLIYYHGSQNCD